MIRGGSKEVAFLVLLAPMMIPYQALLTPLYLQFARFGLIDSRIGLAIVHTILQLPFSVYLMRNAFEAIPREIDEAAMIDGCFGGYFVSSSPAGVAVHLYGGFSASPTIQGRPITIREISEYPWSATSASPSIRRSPPPSS